MENEAPSEWPVQKEQGAAGRVFTGDGVCWAAGGAPVNGGEGMVVVAV